MKPQTHENAQKSTAPTWLRHYDRIGYGLAGLYLVISLIGCARDPIVEPVPQLITPAVPAAWVTPIPYPSCQYETNGHLAECIGLLSDALDTANLRFDHIAKWSFDK